MKSAVPLCLVSVILGAVLTYSMRQDARGPTAQAGGQGQDAPPVRLAEEPRAESPLPKLPQPRGEALFVGEYTEEELVNIRVYEKVNRGVVNISTKVIRPDAFFGFDQSAEGAGSGSVLDKRGHILTNYHVIDGAREIRVTLFDGETYPATLVGQDPVNDLAVVKIDAPEVSLFPVEIGHSARLRVGQKVYAIGNPFGLERTMTVGIISSLNRQLPGRAGRTMKAIIQLDAALNRGNSGGPLLDSRGRMIGVNTAIASRTGTNTGVGFAVPATTVRRVVPALLKDGRVIRPDVGITRVYQTDRGLIIAAMSEGGPAEKAGLRGFRTVVERTRRGPFVFEQKRVDRSHADLIIAVDGKPTKTTDQFLTEIERHKPGERVVISVIRDGRTVDVPVVLGEE